MWEICDDRSIFGSAVVVDPCLLCVFTGVVWCGGWRFMFSVYTNALAFFLTFSDRFNHATLIFPFRALMTFTCEILGLFFRWHITTAFFFYISLYLSLSDINLSVSVNFDAIKHELSEFFFYLFYSSFSNAILSSFVIFMNFSHVFRITCRCVCVCKIIGESTQFDRVLI